jgi:sporulation protein YlmC with PRC-barrel domain
MLLSEGLRGRAVVSVQQAEKLGAISDILVDTNSHRLAGIVVEGGKFRGGETIPWADITTIGVDAVMVDDRSAIQHNVDADSVRFTSLRGRKVVTDAGELAGTIDGMDLDQETGKIAHYVIVAPREGLLRTAPTYHVPAAAIVAVGDSLITVDANVIDFQRTAEQGG